MPLVRCGNHGEALNIGMDGKLFESPEAWELLFTNTVDVARLAPASLFAQNAASPRKTTPESAASVLNASARTSVASELCLPTRPPEARKEVLDLTVFYNGSLTNSWLGSPGNHLGNLPSGVQKFGGVEFDARGVIQLKGKLGGTVKFPSSVRDLPVGAKCRRVHFLHATAFGGASDEGTQVGSYFVRFSETETRLEIPITYGRMVRNWHWQPDEPAAPRELNVAWFGDNELARKLGRPLRLFVTTWTNLLPDFEISSIDFVSAGGNAAPFLLAITVDQNAN